MKIICIGRNYRAHIAEMGGLEPAEPVFFIKPSTACLYHGMPLKLAPHLGQIDHELELVVSIDGHGRDIPAAMAPGFIASYTLGLDLTARNIQEDLKRMGLPWEKAKAFDGSAVLGDIELPMAAGTDLQRMAIELRRNGELVQRGSTSDMIFSVADLIAYVSRYVSFEPGDLLFTGTPAGVGPIAPGDHLEGYLNGDRLLNVQVANG